MIRDIRKVPLLRVVLPFVAGMILAGQSVRMGQEIPGRLLVILLVVILTAMIFLLRPATTRLLFRHVLFGTLLVSFMVVSGMARFRAGAGFRNADIEGRVGFVTGTVLSMPEKKKQTWMVFLAATVYEDDSLLQPLSENIRVYIARDAFTSPEPGERWIFHGVVSGIRNGGNPGEFDYRGYMQRRNCRYHLYVRSGKLASKLPDQGRGWRYVPSRLRSRILDHWDQGDENVAVLSALTLGYKPLLSGETRNDFSDAGAMHLLAVSGLHVGMIWWILGTILRIKGSSRTTGIIKNLLIIGILWMYAGITGYTDSVTRSVTMFSFVSFSRVLRRDANIYNSLVFSAFILLLLRPERIAEPGFQLSYTAVFGIVSMQPVFAEKYASVHRLVRRILDLLSVSIAAQLSTLPLALLYFHQFPSWFLLTNVVAIPLVSLILCVFTLSAPFLVLLNAPGFYSTILTWLAGCLRMVVGKIASLPYATVAGVPMNIPQSVLLYILIFFLVLLFTYRRPLYLVGLMFFAALNLSFSVWQTSRFRATRSVEIFNFNSATLISGFEEGNRSTWYICTDSIPGPFLLEYVESLGRQPYRSDRHTVTRIFPEDSLEGAGYHKLEHGLWSVYPDGKWVLIAGACEHSRLKAVMEAYRWDVILFRRGISWLDDSCGNLQPGTMVVGDGTLQDYENERIKELFPGAWITSEMGAWKWSAESRFLFSIH